MGDLTACLSVADDVCAFIDSCIFCFFSFHAYFLFNLPEDFSRKQQTMLVTATAFNSLPKQGQGNSNVGAWGDKIAPGMNAIAVSDDLVPLGLTRGTRVRVESLKNEYVVLDRMPARWKKRIDIYMGNDVKAARAWGKREVKIYWTVPD